LPDRSVGSLVRPNPAYLPAAPILHAGEVLDTPSTLADRLRVTLPSFSDSHPVEAVGWDARSDGTRPAPGDRCAIAFDEDTEAWVLAWWPA
jgi:crotonobetainyl-CoA:carnitine CoA-transferase CaiB-like acyl-CoA transferase